jgi:NADPH-dependent 7-cyano-7-deazaguanine reductase QueF
VTIWLSCNEYDTVPQSGGACDAAFAAGNGQGIHNESCEPFFAIAKGNEGHRDGELNHESDSKNMNVIEIATPDTTVNCFRTITSDTYHTSATNYTPVDRVITPNQLKAKVKEYDNLSETQRNQLMTALIKYKQHLTKSRYHNNNRDLLIARKR